MRIAENTRCHPVGRGRAGSGRFAGIVVAQDLILIAKCLMLKLLLCNLQEAIVVYLILEGKFYDHRRIAKCQDQEETEVAKVLGLIVEKLLAQSVKGLGSDVELEGVRVATANIYI